MTKQTLGTRRIAPLAGAIHLDPVESAKDAGLRYVDDRGPGIRRRRSGNGFVYTDSNGRPIRDRETLARIASLVIPPAWTDVWICPNPAGHIQAVGRDARGRKQYRYHPRWREVRDQTKYEKMVAFAHALPRIRKRVTRDLRRPGLPREKVLAAVVRLLETTLIRVGNDEYAKSNGHFGLTTLHDKHVSFRHGSIHFEFAGKSGVEHAIDLHDPRLAKIVRQCRDIPGHELFQYVDDDGNRHKIDSTDVNEYLHEIAGEEFTAKDFRTWAGTVLAAMALREFEKFDSQAACKRNIVTAVEAVAEKLGNTKAVCRKCYIHPAVLDSYMDGSLVETLKQRAETRLRSALHALKPEEAAVLTLLRDRLARESTMSKRAA
jgi:DNA topoisomerase-1